MSKPTAETRICKYMNEDNQLSLFMIVKSTLGRRDTNTKVSDCKMTAINLQQAKITYSACKGNTCSQREVVVKFDPPMRSFEDIRPRLVELHHETSEPSISSLYTDPISRIICFLMMGLGYVNLFPDNNDLINELGLGKAIQIAFIFGIGAHLAEAAWVYHTCKNVLKFRTKSAAMWFLVVAMAGYPQTSKVIELVSIHEADVAPKKKE